VIAELAAVVVSVEILLVAAVIELVTAEVLEVYSSIGLCE
jgi:hypothetical protein